MILLRIGIGDGCFGFVETFKIDGESLEKSLKTSCFHLLPQKRMIGKEMN